MNWFDEENRDFGLVELRENVNGEMEDWSDWKIKCVCVLAEGYNLLGVQ